MPPSDVYNNKLKQYFFVVAAKKKRGEKSLTYSDTALTCNLLAVGIIVTEVRPFLEDNVVCHFLDTLAHVRKRVFCFHQLADCRVEICRGRRSRNSFRNSFCQTSFRFYTIYRMYMTHL